MDTLKFKVPLRITMVTSTAFGDGYKDVLLSELDSSKIKGVETLYNCEYNWITDDEPENEREKWIKNYHGYDSSEVLMTATLIGYDYILEVVTTIPLETIVTREKGTEWERKTTLKEAIIDHIKGQLSDGIGENEIGYITYEGEKYDVWFGDLIEL